jgi:hypothetical protein
VGALTDTLQGFILPPIIYAATHATTLYPGQVGSFGLVARDRAVPGFELAILRAIHHSKKGCTGFVCRLGITISCDSPLAGPLCVRVIGFDPSVNRCFPRRYPCAYLVRSMQAQAADDSWLACCRCD